MQSPTINEIITIQNKNFNLPLNLLPKLKDNIHKQFNPPCAELVGVLKEFNYFKDSNPTQEQGLLQLAAQRVNYKAYKQGEYISDSSQNNVHFILKGDIGLFEERNEREIKQEQYWRQQIEKIKKRIEQTNIIEERNKLEEELVKAEKVLKFYNKEDQANLISQDFHRHQINFNINNQCLYKHSQIIKSGVCVGPETEHLERYQNLGQYQLISLSTSLILTLSKEDQRDVFQKNNKLQIKLTNILSKYFNGLYFEKDLLQKIIKNTTELNLTKNEIIYHENYDTSQNLYILTEGNVQITAKRLKQQILMENIESDSIFGTEFLASNKSLRQYTARSQNNPTQIYVLSYDVMKQYFTNEIMDEIQKFAQKKFDEYQSVLNSNIQHIVQLCKQKGLKIPLNYQSISNTDSSDNLNNKRGYQLKSLSPQKKSDISKLSKKHTEVIEQSIQKLKLSASHHNNTMSGQFSVSTNSSSLANSGFENKIQSLYNQISNKSVSNKGGSNTPLIVKTRQSSIDAGNQEEYVHKVTFQATIPLIQLRDMSNDKPNNQQLNKNNTLPNIASPRNEIKIQKISANNTSQNNNLTQNQLLKKYLSAKYNKQSMDKNQSIQNLNDETKKNDPIFRKSYTITKEMLQNQLINIQNSQQISELPIKFLEEQSPIKKKRNYSMRESNNLDFTPKSFNQNKMARQFRVSEEADRYFNQNQTTQSCQQSPIRRQRQECPRIALNQSFEKNKNVVLHKQNKSLSTLVTPNKKLGSYTFLQENLYNKSSYPFNNYLGTSLTNL